MQVSEAITRKSASNLALAFILLPPRKRLGMSALYAFCREVDDVADDESTPAPARQEKLNEWRLDIRKACSGQTPSLPVNVELQPFIKEHSLPLELFDELIAGVEMDLSIQRYETMDELLVYCHRVASVVGLLSIEIFGYADPRCKDYAVHLGKALQLTNILRDVANDAERGRIYLPLQELRRFQVSESQILEGKFDENFERLAASIAAAARDFYQKARETLPLADRPSMATAELMGTVYWRLLQKLEKRRFNSFDGPTARLTKPHKAALILRMLLKLWTGNLRSIYGRA